MSRALTTALKEELLSGRFRPIILFEGEFSSGTVRAWTGVGTLTWNSQSWFGVGDFGGVTPVTESTTVRAENLQVTLSGIPMGHPDMPNPVATMLDELQQNKPATIYFGALTESGVVIVDPFQSRRGLIDLAEITNDGKTAIIRLQIESEFAPGRRPNISRYTHEDQIDRFPGDLGFEYVESIQEKSLLWGRKIIPARPGGTTHQDDDVAQPIPWEQL